jgi:predicted transcriptional regulator
MVKVVLVSIIREKEPNLLVDFLRGLGLKQPLAVSVMKIFIKNKNKPLTYDFLVKKTKEKRSNLVKICQKLNKLGLIEKIYHVPKGKRWRRAFKFTNFSHSVELTKQKAKHLLAPFTQEVSLNG